MAGHSKWANIRFRKAAQDNKRAKIFTKFIRELTVAARTGGSDPNCNPRLRAAIDKALGMNMTRDTLDRAIKRGAGGQEGADMIEIRYEGYGPAGIAVLVDCLTDNRNRTVAEVRHAFSKAGGNLGQDGSVSYLFHKAGLIHLEKNPGLDEETLLEIILDVGADDIIQNADGSIGITTTPEQFTAVCDALNAAGFPPTDSEITLIASTQQHIDDKEKAEKILKLQDALEDLDDVQNVYTNADIPDEILEEIA